MVNAYLTRAEAAKEVGVSVDFLDAYIYATGGKEFEIRSSDIYLPLEQRDAFCKQFNRWKRYYLTRAEAAKAVNASEDLLNAYFDATGGKEFEDFGGEWYLSRAEKDLFCKQFAFWENYLSRAEAAKAANTTMDLLDEYIACNNGQFKVLNGEKYLLREEKQEFCKQFSFWYEDRDRFKIRLAAINDIKNLLDKETITAEDLLQFLNPVSDHMQERINIMKDALDNGSGYAAVSAKLSSRNLREPYLRNLSELVLSFCLKRNQADLDNKKAPSYRLDEFRDLLLQVFIESASHSASEPTTAETDNSAQAESAGCQDGDTHMTFGDLRRFLDEHKHIDHESPGARFAETERITTEIHDKFRGIDFSRDDIAREELIKIVKENAALMAEASESARFYLIKYLYYCICHQILEYKAFMNDISTKSVTAVINEADDDEYADKVGLWSLSLSLQDYTPPLDWSQEQHMRRDVLAAFLKSFLLAGTPETGDAPLYELFVKSQKVKGPDKTPILDEKGIPLKVQIPRNIRDLRECVSIFKINPESSGRNENRLKNKHDRLLSLIENLELKHFYPFHINEQNVYRLLFGQLFYETPSERALEDTDSTERREFIRHLLNGHVDLNRSTLLCFLANAKGLLRHTERLIADPDALYGPLLFGEDTQFLDSSRVNDILSRVGFNTLDDSEAESHLNSLYMDIFNISQKHPEKLTESCEKLRVFIDINQSSLKDLNVKFIETTMKYSNAYREKLYSESEGKTHGL